MSPYPVHSALLNALRCAHIRQAVISFETGAFCKSRLRDHIRLKSRCAPCNGRYMFNTVFNNNKCSIGFSSCFHISAAARFRAYTGVYPQNHNCDARVQNTIDSFQCRRNLPISSTAGDVRRSHSITSPSPVMYARV